MAHQTDFKMLAKGVTPTKIVGRFRMRRTPTEKGTILTPSSDKNRNFKLEDVFGGLQRSVSVSAGGGRSGKGGDRPIQKVRRS